MTKSQPMACQMASIKVYSGSLSNRSYSVNPVQAWHGGFIAGNPTKRSAAHFQLTEPGRAII